MTRRTPTALATELLSLTKMDSNNTQFDQRDPIKLLAADEVGDILRYVGNTDYVESSYAAYM